MKPVDQLEEAVLRAKREGVYLGRVLADLCGPVDTSGVPRAQYSSARPYSVNAFGALLLCRGTLWDPKPYTRLKSVLGVQDSWLYRWSIGWNCRYILQVETSHHVHDGWNPTMWRDDEVSKVAYQMSLRYCDVPRML